ncbi:hypothetical protein BT93_H1384 [Corymbia citriodora subsp. variegata]|nr:hypothetical protein BT93_H1384 [Corymbia citriodora subsp. variegata]
MLVGSLASWGPAIGWECRDLPALDFFESDELFIKFGYDSRSDDYKIVQGDNTENGRVVIFLLKSGVWRMTKAQQVNRLAVSEQGVYWNEALHWCVVNERRNKSKIVIMSFDLSKEKFQQSKLVSVWTDSICVNKYVKIPAYTRHGKIVFQIDTHQITLLNPEDDTNKEYPIQSDGHIESAIYLETLVSSYLGCKPSRI